MSIQNIVTIKIALSTQREQFIKNWLDVWEYAKVADPYWSRRIQEIGDAEAALRNS
jgi:hypothetical protein